MGLYKIMIVDDEREIREGIARKIDWEKSGFELIASAENGQEALELAENLAPDVVITDIKMPFMDGLTLAKLLSERLPAAKVVIFSGFDDFEYAQKAIQYGVTEYILKPVGAQELTATLGELRNRLDVEIQQKNDMDALREHYTRSLPLLHDLFLTRLLDGKLPAGRITEQAEVYGVRLAGKYFAAALVGCDDGSGATAFGNERELIPISVRRLLDEMLLERFEAQICLYNDGVAIVCGLEARERIMELIAVLNFCCVQAKRFLGLTLTVGLGRVCEGAENLRKSAQSAAAALDYRALLGAGQVIYIDDVEPARVGELVFDEQDARELAAAVKLGDAEAMERGALRFVSRLRESRLPLKHCQLYFSEMATELVKIVRDYRIDADEVFGPEFDGSFRISRFSSPDELFAWFQETCAAISTAIRRERINSSQQIADRAKAFIAERYFDPALSVEALCGHLHLSPAYFSTLFKRETGVSFVQFLTDTRLAEAVKLLSTTQLKTYEIAERVGYLEPNYFSYVFKKKFGVSPTKYLGTGQGNV
ncbi:MAG: response regulator [Oscillospiraceae bacterium]|jgi:two-component system response regulator YesN|nr:response regulator [Oscillospiraceae bacterium]